MLTADYVQADERGKLNGIGIGWSIVATPLPAHGVAVIVGVDLARTNERLPFLLELIDGDGHPVSLNGELDPVVHIEGEIEQGRPPALLRGTELTQAVAFNLPAGMSLKSGQRYEYRVTVGEAEGAASFSVMEPQQS